LWKARSIPRGPDEILQVACDPFFPVGHDIRAVVVEWVNFLKQDRLWGMDDPLFPMTKVAVGDNLKFEATGLNRKHWSSAGPIRVIFKQAFTAAGLPYFNARALCIGRDSAEPYDLIFGS
jgi:hypothetical protein